MKKTTSFNEAKEIFDIPFISLLHRAQEVHQRNFKPNEVQISTLLSIKTGSCPENCSYCPQSAHYDTKLKKEPLMDIEDVIKKAKIAKEAGSTRFCIGAAWRGPRDSDLDKVIDMIKEIKKMDLETCATLGLLKKDQAKKLKESGLDFYNHNIDSSPEFYKEIITTRSFEDRINTIKHVRESGIKVCCGGILGMGESTEDRIKMLLILANFDEQPESVPINKLIKVAGTPLENVEEIDSFNFVRIIALARILLPKSYIRLSAGRDDMSDELQALCFMAGANSIFYGEKLLTSKNSPPENDKILFKKLGINQ